MPAKVELGEPKSDDFVATKQVMDNAVSVRADELAPQVYNKAVKNYLAAEEKFEAGKDISKIQKKLEKAEKLAKESIEVAQTMQTNYSELIESRDKAISAGADDLDLKSYKRAEKFLLRTASDIENDGIEKARKSAEKATREFEKAELEAIQENLVGDLSEQLKEAAKQGADNWTPKTYDLAKNFRDDALETLMRDRYNQEKAQQEVERGAYYARKAMFLTDKIKESKGDRENWENLYLQREEDLNKIASTLGIEPNFDKGFEGPVSEIDQAYKDLKETERSLKAQLRQTEQSLAQAQVRTRQEAQAKQRIASRLQMTETTLQQQRILEQKIKQVQELFPGEEAKVSLDAANNITITLFGLNFEPGKSTLSPEYYPLLVNVNKAVQMFPDRKIQVVGHTDSTGSEEFNKRLSLERAKSVAQFMEEGLGVPAGQLETSGAGESEPIVPNTTAEGRKLNRRIEVTLLSK